MPSQSVYTTTHHLDHPSVFHNMQVPDDPAQLEAIHLWELTADSKYIDIKGYGYCRLIKSVAPRECARLEIDKINLLLETGECDFFTGYLDDLDLVQIPFCNQALVTGRWDCFISIKETQRYLNSEQDDLTLNDYFSKRWIVATQVQALIWYKLYLLDVVENGLQVRDPDNNVNQDTNKLTQLVNYFVLKGEFWEITFNQKTVHIKNTKGIRYIDYLIRNKGKETHVSELYYAINPQDINLIDQSTSNFSNSDFESAGLSISSLRGRNQIMTPEGKERLQNALLRLKEKIEDAKALQDLDLQEQLEDEEDQILLAINKDYGLGGKPREADSLVEQFRKNITNSITKDKMKLQALLPELVAHLKYLQTGTFCCYQPHPDTKWR